MSYTVLDPLEIEPHHGRFRRLSEPLGAELVGVNHIGLDPGQEGRGHDHSADGQEEIYFFTDGSGTLVVDGEEVSVRAGQLVRVSPASYRQLKAGDAGLSWLGLGVSGGAR